MFRKWWVITTSKAGSPAILATLAQPEFIVSIAPEHQSPIIIHLAMITSTDNKAKHPSSEALLGIVEIMQLCIFECQFRGHSHPVSYAVALEDCTTLVAVGSMPLDVHFDHNMSVMTRGGGCEFARPSPEKWQ